MSDRRNTRPDGVPIDGMGPPYAFDYECDDRHKRSTSVANEALDMATGSRDLLIELAGRSGKNGRIGTMATEIEELKEWKGNVNSFVLKLAIAALVSSGIGGGIAVAIAKAIGG